MVNTGAGIMEIFANADKYPIRVFCIGPVEEEIHFLPKDRIKYEKRNGTMQDILMRAGCFVAVIIMGYTLRQIGFFKAEDFNVLAKIVIRITLPASIIYSFSGMEVDPSMLLIAALGLAGGIIYMGLGWLLNRRAGKEQQAFAMLNTTGYNIGNFTMPFVQSFLGPMGVITTSLYDTGNAFICLGGAFSMASMVKDNKGFSIKRVLKSLLLSVPFDCYMIMIILNLVHVTLPSPIVSLAGLIGNANAFMAMLMLGVGFKLSGDRKQIGKIVKMLSVRYGVACAIALGCFLLPFPLGVRRALMVLAFSPIASAAPAFTEEMKGDVGLASAINSLSIVISIICIVALLLITL